MSRVVIEAVELDNVRQLERRHSAKLLFAEVWPNGHAFAEMQPVADVNWCIDVWDGEARLMLIRDEGGYICANDELDLDADLLDELVQQVVCHDHGSDLSISRVYYPLSQTSVELFERLKARAAATTEQPAMAAKELPL